MTYGVDWLLLTPLLCLPASSQYCLTEQFTPFHNTFTASNTGALFCVGGSVDHDGGKAVVDAGLAGFEIRAVIQMHNDRDIGALDDSSLNQLP